MSEKEPYRTREYTAKEMKRWGDAIRDDLSNTEFRKRFGIDAKTARRVAEQAGTPLPERVFDHFRHAKAPPTAETFYAQPRSRRTGNRRT